MAKRKTKEEREQDKIDYEEIRSYKPLHERIGIGITFFLGSIILARGIYLITINGYDQGFTFADQFGLGGGEPTGFSAAHYLFAGSIILIFNLFLLITYYRKGKKNK